MLHVLIEFFVQLRARLNSLGDCNEAWQLQPSIAAAKLKVGDELPREEEEEEEDEEEKEGEVAVAKPLPTSVSR